MWVFLVRLRVFIKHPITSIKLGIFKLIMVLPLAKSFATKEKNKVRDDIVNDIKKKRKNPVYKLPKESVKEDTIMKRVEEAAKYPEAIYKAGKMSGGVYFKEDDHWNFIAEVMRISMVSNPLHMDEFFFTN